MSGCLGPGRVGEKRKDGQIGRGLVTVKQNRIAGGSVKMF